MYLFFFVFHSIGLVCFKSVIISRISPAVHCCCYFLGISRIDKKSSVTYHLGKSSVIRSDNWESCMHSFKHWHTKSFDKTRKYKRLCLVVKICELSIGYVTKEMYSLFYAEFARKL